MPTRQIGDIEAELTGAGEPVVLLHGNGEDRRVLAAQADALRDRYLVIAPDSRAHGGSRRGRGPLTIARMSDDVAELIARVAGAPAHVIGYSDGANIAMELAIRHPDLVRSLVLISGNLDPAGLGRFGVGSMRVVEGALWTLEKVAGALAPAGRITRWARRRREIWRLMTVDPHIAPSDLARVSVPALVMVGERDVIRPGHSRLIAASLPRGRLVVIEHAGHTLIRTQPQAVNEAIAAFLATA